MTSESYQKGLLANSYSDNPHDSNSNRFDEFERGQTQKLKRQPCSDFNNSTYKPRESLKGCRVVAHEITNSYKYKNK